MAAGEEDALRGRLRALLLELRDPASDAPLVTEVRDPAEHPELGGPHGGDLSFRLARGVFATGEATGPVVYEAAPQGEHLLEPDRPEMHASFAVAGPGVAAGVVLGVIQQTDIAPTLAALLGLDPPAQATGRLLGGVLASRGPR